MVLSIIMGTLSLAYGYWQEGYSRPAWWIVLLGAAWLLAEWRRSRWFASAALLLMVFAAGFGVWQEFPLRWMLLGALGGVLGWDLSDFSHRQRYAVPDDHSARLERNHLARAAIVAAAGLWITYFSVLFQNRRVAFEVAVSLTLLTTFWLIRLLLLRSKRY
jgi:hypothetical protein